jgi:phospholipase/carboxylesterase
MQSLALTVDHVVPAAGELGRTGNGRVTMGDDLQAFLMVPSTLEPGRAYPLVIVMHGAGRQDELLFKGLQGEPDRRQALFLIPRSYQMTWDLIAGGNDTDLRFLAYCLRWVYQRYAVDPARQALLGYSDGASYALAVGLSNPRIFSAVMAWAAGFLAIDANNLRPDDPKPHLFVEYGDRDPLFPYAQVALPMRDALQQIGYPLVFRTDEGGGHWPSPRFQPEALDWFFALP